MSDQFRILDASSTHVGKVRAENEDSLVSMSREGVWIVADGMGGHEHGKFASQTIVEAVAEAASAIDPQAPWEGVAAAIHAANRQIFDQSRKSAKRMGSTIVALVFHGEEFVVLWAGDSRAYLLRDAELYRLTRDHTVIESMLERGLLTPEDALDHPMRHAVERAVGVEEVLELEAVRDRVVAQDLFLLCSDGLHGVLSDAHIAALLREHGADAGDLLIEACLAAGAPDNVTVTLVAANERTLVTLHGAAP